MTSTSASRILSLALSEDGPRNTIPPSITLLPVRADPTHMQSECVCMYMCFTVTVIYSSYRPQHKLIEMHMQHHLTDHGRLATVTRCRGYNADGGNDRPSSALAGTDAKVKVGLVSVVLRDVQHAFTRLFIDTPELWSKHTLDNFPMHEEQKVT